MGREDIDRFREKWNEVIRKPIEANIGSGILTAEDYMITIGLCEPKHKPKQK